MSLIKRYQTDPELEKNGTLVEYGPNEDLPKVNGKHPIITFKIARAGGANDAYNKRLEALLKKHRRQIQTDTIDVQTLKDLNRQVFFDTVLLGWENVTIEGNEPVAFTRDNAIKLFELVPDVYDDLQELANKGAAFRKSLQEVDAGN